MGKGLVVGLFVVVGAGCATDQVSSRAQPILNGTPDATSSAVVAIVQNVGVCGAPSLDCGCSGVLVAPRVVLTAAHCLDNAPASALEAFFGDTIDAPGTRIPVIEGIVHPSYDKSTHAWDVAALVLASAASVAPVSLRSAAVTVGTEVRVVGFGVDDTKAGRVGVRRTGTAEITSIADAEVRIAAKPSMTCHGDSGGPVFVGEELVGITTWGDAPCLSFGAAARVDRLDGFLAPIVEQAKALLVQPAFDPALCGRSCKSATDCPTGTACVGGTCAFHGLSGYQLGKSCAAASDCSEACLDTPAGCRCIERCGDPPATSPSGEGSCATSRTRFTPLWALIALAVLRRRR